ncbi:MAG: thioesterase domain-containing protein [Candidatus Thiodiazotropha sp.]|nr:thioesterase domain-containing protein [Candidatus Thiodiazotropha sp.]MCM8882202.1 thioesterase domain-containing protein [Candidatus Thiodiazotropha sp.]MCM8919587.1 thioesterase domain-containing protein [Candidatus Thiodiazotropha sp.]MCU7872531.1 thioesterase domain-containing protein [Candidatus Thiodiazotropha sp. (ex Lucinoma borealis)]
MSESKAAALQVKINQTIPLSRAMGYQIQELDSRHIVVEAPLKPNVNIHGSGFAGSIYSLGALTAWALGSHIVDQAGLDVELVITEASIRYRTPIRESIHCLCRVSEKDRQHFVAKLLDQGKARLAVEVEIGKRAVLMHATLHAKQFK